MTSSGRFWAEAIDFLENKSADEVYVNTELLPLDSDGGVELMSEN
jgi:hypothetical protein